MKLDVKMIKYMYICIFHQYLIKSKDLQSIYVNHLGLEIYLIFSQ